jgi:hypothetical protein
MCLNKHLQDDWTIDLIFKTFGKKVQPHTYHEFNIANCLECSKIRNEKKAVPEKQKTQRKTFERKEKREFSIDEELERTQARYRSDQRTHVTLHSVYFVLLKTGQVPVICNASFHGKVIYSEFEIVDGGIQGKVHVVLQPIEGVSFSETAPFRTLNGLRLSKSKKGLCYVELNDAQLSSNLCILGSRCKENKCKIDCDKHILRPLIMSRDVPVALKKIERTRK